MNAELQDQLEAIINQTYMMMKQDRYPKSKLLNNALLQLNNTCEKHKYVPERGKD